LTLHPAARVPAAASNTTNRMAAGGGGERRIPVTVRDCTCGCTAAHALATGKGMHLEKDCAPGSRWLP
jgi:hypothetical protein